MSSGLHSCSQSTDATLEAPALQAPNGKETHVASDRKGAGIAGDRTQTEVAEDAQDADLGEDRKHRIAALPTP